MGLYVVDAKMVPLCFKRKKGGVRADYPSAVIFGLFRS